MPTFSPPRKLTPFLVLRQVDTESVEKICARLCETLSLFDRSMIGFRDDYLKSGLSIGARAVRIRPY